MSQPKQDERHFRGRKHRGKEKEEDPHLLTLEEWERRKTGGNPLAREDNGNTSQDEDLARMLQNQFDLEDLHVQKVPQESEADELKKSMFSFQREDAEAHDRAGFRGRGRGRGRGRRGRGRGRF